MSEKWDVVIVGSGLAGLIAANFLANSDLSVLVIEKSRTIGGRGKTEQIRKQYFNIGPHALYKKGKARSILEELRIKISGKSPQLSGLLIKDNIEYLAPFTPLGLLKTNLLTLREKMEWISVLLKLTIVNTESLSKLNFQQWVQQAAKSDNVQSLLFVLSRLATYCHSPEHTSAKIIVSQLKTVINGVLYIDGGWQTIIDQLYKNAISSGVRIQTHSTVKQIIDQGGNGYNITLSHAEEVFSKYVLYTASPLELQTILEKDKFPILNKYLSKTIPVKGATLDIALSKLTNPDKLFVMGLTNPIYYSVHSKYAKLSETEGNILHVFKYYQPDETPNFEEVKQELEQFLEQIQPGWQDYVIARRFIPKITVNQRIPEVIDEHQLDSMLFNNENIFFAGDWACEDAILLEGAAISAEKAAKAILNLEMS